MNKNSYRYKHNWRLTFFALIFFPILIALGFWQIQRAEEKLQIQKRWLDQQNTASIDLNVTDLNSVANYTRLTVSGRYIVNNYWLQEGRSLASRPGYHVISPFELTDGRIILIDRGWIKANMDRRIYPQVSSPSSILRLSGLAYTPSSNPLIRENLETQTHWPKRIVQINTELMQKQLLRDLLTYVLVLDDHHQSAYQYNQTVVNISPDKHRAYAIQWFMLALVLVAAWFYASWERPCEKPKL
ncbi:SURF1 family protein [Agaribacterium haliotis]|uniref:SURF1 family protein n=1 Tax=Agaribacterium haliotis TaxID=2013869 RepID=UPI000BB59294|nr:SURF1 family protein [Agaribacterium haliotis]